MQTANKFNNHFPKLLLIFILFIISILPLTTQAFYTFPTKIDTKVKRMNVQTVLNTVMTPSPNLKVDGVFGRKTIQTIKAFQDSHGLVADGKIGPITRIALENSQTGRSSTYTPITIITTNGCSPGALYNTQTGKPCATTSNNIPTLTSPTTVGGGGGSSNEPTYVPTTPVTPPITPFISDTTKPIITSFSVPPTSTSLVVPITLSATDNTAVTGYFLSELSSTPNISSGSWTSIPSSIYTFLSEGVKILYAWARDGAGNISNSLSRSTTISLSVTPSTPTTIIAVSSTSNDGHVDTNTLDRVFTDDSRWSALGDGEFITYTLNQVSSVSYVRFAFYAGTAKYFDIKYSTDNVTWSNASTSLTSAVNMSNQYQTFSFTPVNTKYIRFVGHGSSASLWNSITETDINGFAVNIPTISVTPPVCVPEATVTTCLNKCGSQTNNCGTAVACTACVTPPPTTPVMFDYQSVLSNPNVQVLFKNNFEQRPLGKYATMAEFDSDWNISGWGNRGENLEVENDNGSKVAKFTYPFYNSNDFRYDCYGDPRCVDSQGRRILYNDWGLVPNQNLTGDFLNGVGPYSGGGQWYTELNGNYDDAYLLYKVKFSSGFDAVDGGKLLGFYGNDGTNCGACNVTDCNGDGIADSFASKLMFHTGELDYYLYHYKKLAICGDGGPVTNSNIYDGNWHTILFHTKMNNVGSDNGIAETWIDGIKQNSYNNLTFKFGQNVFGIQTLGVGTFFGGDDRRCSDSQVANGTNGCAKYLDGTNYFWYAPRKTEYFYIDNLIVYTPK